MPSATRVQMVFKPFAPGFLLAFRVSVADFLISASS